MAQQIHIMHLVEIIDLSKRACDGDKYVAPPPPEPGDIVRVCIKCALVYHKELE